MMLSLIPSVVGLIGVPVAARSMTVGSSGRLLLIAVFVVISACGGVALAVVAVGMARTIRREQAAGYTTLFNATKRNLWQLNPKTGEVVRAPGGASAP